jgi:hypothetical protein
MKIKRWIFYLLWLPSLLLAASKVDDSKLDSKINSSEKTDDFIVRDDGTIQSIDEVRKEARGEADKIQQYDARFYAGEYLIYDCKQRHFACVNKDGFEYCKLARKKTRIEGHSIYACAHLKSFDTLTNCLEKQYEFMHSLPSKFFCINTTPATYMADQAFTEIIDVEEVINKRLQEDAKKEYLLLK